MKTLTLKITDLQRNNAIALLKRVPLKGEEAPALVDLLNLLRSAAPEPEAPSDPPAP